MLLVNRLIKEEKRDKSDGREKNGQQIGVQDTRKPGLKFSFGEILRRKQKTLGARGKGKEKEDGSMEPKEGVSKDNMHIGSAVLGPSEGQRVGKDKEESTGSSGNFGVLETKGDESRLNPYLGSKDMYSSFTARCISLHNSEMTSASNLDEQATLNDTSIRPNAEGRLHERLEVDPLDSSLQHNKEVFDMDNDVNDEIHKVASGNFSSDDMFTDFDGTYGDSDFDEECYDVVELLSETESDLNFNPRQEENVCEYKFGGYHPVSKGEVYFSLNFPNREYIICRKLGWGQFSTVWLAKVRTVEDFNSSQDSSLASNEDFYVALKFIKSNEHYREAAMDEIRLLTALQDPLGSGHLTEKYKKYFRYHDKHHLKYPGNEHVMKLLDHFDVTGPNGTHICMAFEILGENILSLIMKFKRYHKELKSRVTSELVNNPEKPEHDASVTKPHKVLNSSKFGLGMIGLRGSCAKHEETEKKSLPIDSLLKLIGDETTYGALPLRLAKNVVRQILQAVNYIHRCGIIHTDLKPENILLEIKDMRTLVKMIEEDKVNRHMERHGLSRRNLKATSGCNSIACGSSIKTRSSSQNMSLPKMRSILKRPSMCSYRKSRNSIANTVECPVKLSKPLSSIASKDLLKIFTGADCLDSLSRSKTSSSISNLESFFENSDNVCIKIADLGNATFYNHHFTLQIQTRQYRAPEIILKSKTWGAAVDMWSIGCIVFELITGDYLFEPRGSSSFSKDDDHLAQIIELKCEFPSSKFIENCEYGKNFFKKDGEGNYYLRNIEHLKYWSLFDVLVDKYKFDSNDTEVTLLCDFLLKCLSYDLKKRFDCLSLLNHPWLKDDITYADMDSMRRMSNRQSEIPGFTR